MPSRHSKNRSADRPRDEPAILSAVVVMGMMALLAMRWMRPTEASVDGETLWIVQGWLALGALWIWDSFRHGRPLVTRDALTLGVILIVAGHVASGLAVFQRGGDKRAAMNVMWEWVSLGVTFLIARSYCRRVHLSQRLLWGLTAVAVALAGWGLYQHYVWFPRTRTQYESMKKELTKILDEGRVGTNAELRSRQRRLIAVQEKFRRFGIPVSDPVARELWEKRLYSDEPFGPFALTNTFAGLLVAMLMIAAGALIGGVRDNRGRKDLLAPGLAAGVILWCLLLTKSRTAWVGGLCGIGVWATLRGGLWNRRGFLWIAGGVVGIASAAAIVTLAGGLDHETISESPKSVQYRLEYWVGTADVIAEFPLLGPGPGNFRQHYLKYKLPGASEEIRDPHNFLLDLWCSGGLLAFAGLLVVLGAAVRRIIASRDDGWTDLPPSTDPLAQAMPWAMGSLLGVLLLVLISWFYMDGDLGLYSGVLGAVLLLLPMLSRSFAQWRLPRSAMAAAGVALLVHLLGAGGIEMPAIAQIVLLLSAVIVESAQPAEKADPEAIAGARKPIHAVLAIAGSGLMMILFGVCLSTATLPVMTRNAAMNDAKFDPASQRDYKRAARRFEEAAAADPFSAEPSRELAMLYYTRYRMRTDRIEMLSAAIKAQQQVVRMEPHHFAGYWRLGRWLAQRSGLRRESEDRKAALEAFQQAVDRYPNNARLLREHAEILHCSQQPDLAVAQAGKALRLDDLNRAAGHQDKFLTDEDRTRLKAIQAGTAKWPCGR